MDSKKINNINSKVAEWLGRGVEVKKIQTTAWNNWGVLSEIKNGKLVLAAMNNKSDGRGGRKWVGQTIIGEYDLG